MQRNSLALCGRFPCHDVPRSIWSADQVVVRPRGSGRLRMCTWKVAQLVSLEGKCYFTYMCAVCDFRKRGVRPCWVCSPGGPYPCPPGSACFERGRLKEKGLCQVPLHKPGQNGSSQSVAGPDPSSSGVLSTFGDLTAFLCSTSWPDGSRRERGTLLITAGAGKWTLKVKDPNGNRYAFYAANTLSDALAGLDLGLSTDELDWRPEKPFQARK